MSPSEAAYNLLKGLEGLRLSAYQDASGVPTVGYGHTAGVHMGQTITSEQAGAFLADDLAVAAAAVNQLVKVPLTQNQFDALVSFVFNVGEGSLARSTLLKWLNSGHYQDAAKQFGEWCIAAGKVMPGLVKRRAAERALFEAG